MTNIRNITNSMNNIKNSFKEIIHTYDTKLKDIGSSDVHEGEEEMINEMEDIVYGLERVFELRRKLKKLGRNVWFN